VILRYPKEEDLVGKTYVACSDSRNDFIDLTPV